ncbi:putative thioesterase superfamily protein [Zalerion maritima]|uniref:Thioesterase superfamily protein n=1 Tax=Zalerion maritima TaxID=339359 RepID=A0AAD5WY64_9PEZI|nr:putative thioesterase superfamily protein [Zalerion maritima]
MPRIIVPPVRFVRSVLNDFMQQSGLEPRLFANCMKITDASKGKVGFEIKIQPCHTNRLSIIHGGTIASLVDLGGSLAVASVGLFQTGVTTDLNVTYLSPGGKVGDILRGTAECDKWGKVLAYTRVSFHNEKGQLAARGSHTKFIAKAQQEDLYGLDESMAVPEEPLEEGLLICDKNRINTKTKIHGMWVNHHHSVKTGNKESLLPRNTHLQNLVILCPISTALYTVTYESTTTNISHPELSACSESPNPFSCLDGSLKTIDISSRFLDRAGGFNFDMTEPSLKLHEIFWDGNERYGWRNRGNNFRGRHGMSWRPVF